MLGTTAFYGVLIGVLVALAVSAFLSD